MAQKMDDFIYLAAGDGLAILDMNATYVGNDGKTYNRAIKKFSYKKCTYTFCDNNLCNHLFCPIFVLKS